MALKGIDVSYHNGTINWKQVKSAGIDFAIIRAGYGRVVDKKFAAYIKAAKEAGVPVGIYWFCYALNHAQAIAEAEFCAKTLKAYKIDLPVFYDFEYDTERYAGEHGVKYDRASRTDIIKTFCERIKELGYTPGVYVNFDYINYKVNWSELMDYKFWLAHWSTKNGVVASFDAISSTSVNDTRGKPMLWQFGSVKVNGIKGAVDANFGYFELPESNGIVAGDVVRVINTKTGTNGRIIGKTYTGGNFTLWYKQYDVIQIKGKRAVIGVDGVVTAAVHVDNLEKV